MATHSSALEMVLAENLSLCDDEDISPEKFLSSHDVEMTNSLKDTFSRSVLFHRRHHGG